MVQKTHTGYLKTHICKHTKAHIILNNRKKKTKLPYLKFHIRKIELLAFDTQYYLIHTKKPIQTGRKNRYWRKSSSIVQDEGSVILTKK